MRYLTVEQVITLHDCVLEYGGVPGLRSRPGLEAAVGMPQQSAFGEDAYPTLAAQAAALGFFLTMNHPFVDGNKRTGLAALTTFLALNDWGLATDEDDAVDVFERLASGALSREAFFAWVASHLEPLPPTL